jgi:uncharacterized membrane protein
MTFFWIIAGLTIIGLIWKYLKDKKDQELTPEDKESSISSLWYLLPWFAGFVGGLIAWLCVHNRNPKEARVLLIGGVIMTIFATLLYLMPYFL